MKPDRDDPLPSGREAEYLALMIMGIAGRRFMAGQPGLAQDDFVRELGATPEHVARAVDALIAHGFLTESGQQRTLLVPARDLESVTLGALWLAIRSGAAEPRPHESLGRDVRSFLDAAERCFVESQGRSTLREWLKSEPPKPAA